ncbi:hypothetical protein DRN98_07405 [Methanosarcinales archaeon]|nr:MAG: hypothetical protein DRN13_03255 [Thermoplasmata archaeon]RLG30373.1 MAG: hypothetical protein DRN98_07405 [Methanosarcinales archaeon]
MRTDEVVMLVLYASDRKMVAGRTLLQKTIYFLNEKNNLGIEFVPYYYGPYSAEIADAVESLKASGIVKEVVEEFPVFNTSVGFEPRRYIYQLTEIGEKIAENVKNKYPEEAERIRDQLSFMKTFDEAQDYRNLSIAAKMYHILKIENKPRTIDEIKEEAEFLGWNIGEKGAEDALNFLKGLKMVE